MDRRFVLAVSPLLLALSMARVAGAEPSKADLDRAEKLFQEGKSLMAEKKFEEGCPKLQESQKIDPATGTLLALALCHEGQGRIGTAYREFKQALPAAVSEKRRDREQLATTHANDLAPRVPKVVIELSPDTIKEPSLTVAIDGERVERANYNNPVMVDPGERLIEVHMEGRLRWKGFATLAERETKTLRVPSLAPMPDESAPDDPAPRQGDPNAAKRTLGIVLVGVAGVGIAAGSIFGISAINKNDEAESKCEPKSCTSAEGLKLNDESRSAATASTIFFVVGVAAGAAGVVLLATSSNKRVSAAPIVTPQLVGLGARATF